MPSSAWENFSVRAVTTPLPLHTSWISLCTIPRHYYFNTMNANYTSTVIKIEYHFLCRFGAGSGMIWLDDVGCSGNESCLLSCSRNGIGDSNCSHVGDVAIFCSGSPSSSTNCSFINSKFACVCTHHPPINMVVCTPLNYAEERRPGWTSGRLKC